MWLLASEQYQKQRIDIDHKIIYNRMCIEIKNALEGMKMSVRRIGEPKKPKSIKGLRTKSGASRKYRSKLSRAYGHDTPWGKPALRRRMPNPNARMILERRRQLLVQDILMQGIYTQECEKVIFSHEDLHTMYKENEEFRSIMDSGNYMFYQQRLVVKTCEAFRVENGILALNLDAVGFDEKYCLRVIHKSVPHTHITEAIIQPKTGPTQKVQVPISGFVTFLSFKRATSETSLSKTEQKRFSKFLDYYDDDGNGPTNTFGQMLTMHMERMHYKDATMDELTGISDKTIQRYRLDEVQPQLPYIVAICIALQLIPKWSEDMIALAGYSLRKIMPDQAYSYLLNTQFENGDVAYCNRFLQEYNQPPLTKKIE